jgi:lipopolysaccharide heptosyltransferase II
VSAARRVRLAGLRLVAALCRPGAPAATTPRRVLVLRPDHLGDLLFATPALRRLRAALPDAEIVGLVGPWGEPILGRSPHLDGLIAWDVPWFNRRSRGGPLAPYLSALRLARLLRERQFDAALVLRFDFWWGALAAHLAGIPRRIGYGVPEVAPFLTDAVPYLGVRHEVERNHALVAALVGETERPADPRSEPVEFAISSAEAAAADELLARHGIRPDERLVVVHPGAGGRLKLWTAHGFAAVGDALSRRHGARLVLTGGPGEADLTSAVARASAVSPIDLAGQTSLGVLAALLRRALLVVGPDSGPLHVAVAVGTPTVHLYGPVDERLFGPWGDPARHAVVRHALPCAPCNRLDRCARPDASRGCVLGITVEQVLAAAEKVVAAGTSRQRILRSGCNG